MNYEDKLLIISRLHQLNQVNVKEIEKLLINCNMIFNELKILEDKLRKDDTKIITGLN